LKTGKGGFSPAVGIGDGEAGDEGGGVYGESRG